MKKRTLFAALLIVPMGAAFAQGVGEAKANAMQALTEAKAAAAEMNVAATRVTGELQDKYRAMADKATSAVEAIREAIAQTSDSAVARGVAAKTSNAARALEATVIAIKANNIAEASAKATNIGEAITQAAKVVHAVAAETAARAVKEAAADIQAAAR